MLEDLEPLARFIQSATTTRAGSNLVFEICSVTVEQAEALRIEIGIELEGYKHILDDGSIRHVIKQHGNRDKEELRGQVAVTEMDFTLIPSILTEYDKVRSGGKSSLGLDVIIFEKVITDTYFYLVEVRTGRKRLSMKTLYKRKAPIE